jgi:hypothetical protein
MMIVAMMSRDGLQGRDEPNEHLSLMSEYLSKQLALSTQDLAAIENDNLPRNLTGVFDGCYKL